MTSLLFGYNTNGFAHHRLEDALLILAEIGYRSVALTLDYHSLNPFGSDLRDEVERIRPCLEPLREGAAIETGARFLLDPWKKHQPTLISAAADDRRRRLDFLMRAIDLAAELKIGVVSFWSGASDDRAPRDLLLQRLVAGCALLCDHAAKRNVRLAFEPEPGMLIDTMASYSELAAKLNQPAFGLTIDIGHLHCQGETPIPDYLDEYGERLWNIHIEDMKHGFHEHLPFGRGEINFPPILQKLREMGYSGGVHVELSRQSSDAVATAEQSLRFLQSV